MRLYRMNKIHIKVELDGSEYSNFIILIVCCRGSLLFIIVLFNI